VTGRLFQRKLPRDYGEITYASRYRIVRYPHRKRYETAERKILGAAPRRLLDYGAGDGKLVCELLDRGLDAEVIAHEPDPVFQRQIAERAEASALSSRIEIVGDRNELEGPFDFISCLGVLEHLPLPEREAFYAACDSALDERGTILIDVPVEVGPTLAVKAAGRILLKGRGKEYSWSELLRYSSGFRMVDPQRFDPTNSRTFIFPHRGFDYRLLAEELEGRFEIVDRVSTPMSLLPAWCFNQEVFLTATRHAS
jgi:hypothetical protein